MDTNPLRANFEKVIADNVHELMGYARHVAGRQWELADVAVSEALSNAFLSLSCQGDAQSANLVAYLKTCIRNYFAQPSRQSRRGVAFLEKYFTETGASDLYWHRPLYFDSDTTHAYLDDLPSLRAWMPDDLVKLV